MRAASLVLRRIFPKVRQLQTEELQQWMNEKRKVILLDVREINESQVSRIGDAISIKPDEPADQVLKKVLGKDVSGHEHHPVVAYCSVGYRASNMAQNIMNELSTMKKAGKDVPSMDLYNLEGAIFKWANEGRTLFDSKGSETKYCHPFSTIWGMMFLDPRVRKYK